MAEKLRRLTLTGSPYERGIQHGEHLRALIAEHYGRWRDHITRDTGLSPEVYLEKFFEQTDFMPAIKRYTPDLLEEVQGLAAGANQPLAHVLARQCSDEETWFRQVLRYGRPVPEHCSALAAVGTGDRPNIVAQNMDLVGYSHGFETVLRINGLGPEPDALVFTVAGKISLAGMNSRGVAIACNTVLFLDFNPAGLPEDFIVRKTLQQASLADAVAFMQSIPHASGQNYVLGDPQDVTDLEASAGQVVPFEPLQNPKRVYHTNHPLRNPDTESWDALMARGEREAPQLVAAVRARMTTYDRCDAVKTRVEQSEQLDVENVKDILSTHDGGVCIHFSDADHNYTAGCLVMVLDPAQPHMHVAPGPGCQTPFTILDFNS